MIELFILFLKQFGNLSLLLQLFESKVAYILSVTLALDLSFGNHLS